MNEYELQIATGNAYTLAIPNSKGDDGITPTVTITDITGGHHVAFSYGSGDPRNTSFDVMDGSDGTNGQDGITPTVVVTNITGGHNVAFNYGAGDSRNTNFDVLNGDPGQGIASGGTAGQVLKKKSATDYDTEWGDAESGSNIVVVNFTYSAQPYSLTADKTYQEVKAVIDAGGFAVAIVNHGYSMYELSSVSNVQISFSKHTFTDGTNSGVKIARTTFSLLAEGGCGSIGSEKTYGGNYPVWTLKLAVTDDGYAVEDYDISWLERIIGKKNADFQVWVYPSQIAYYNDSEYDVYRLQKAEQWYDGDTQLSMTAGEFVNITDGKVKKIRIEMEEYGDWGNADYTYTETSL